MAMVRKLPAFVVFLLLQLGFIGSAEGFSTPLHPHHAKCHHTQQLFARSGKVTTAAAFGSAEIAKALREGLPPISSTGVWAKVAVGVSFAVISSGVKVVQQGDVAIIERLGKYQKNLEPGLHFIVPFVDRERKRHTRREQVFDIPPQKCITSDNAPLAADAVVYWRVVDPANATYSVVDLELAIQNLVLTQLRSEIGKLTLDETFSAREKINSVLLGDLDVATEPWGIKITRVEVRDIIPNQEIMQAMEQQMAAERTRRAKIIQSEGERDSAVNAARGQAESRVIDAKSRAEATKLKAGAEAAKLELEAQGATIALQFLAKELGSEQAAKFQLAREQILAKNALALSENAKVIVTSGDPVSDTLGKAVAFYESRNDTADE